MPEVANVNPAETPGTSPFGGKVYSETIDFDYFVEMGTEAAV